MEEKNGKEFEKIANPDSTGKSKAISLESVSDNLKVTNGSNFSRKNSYLDKKYYLEKQYEKGTVNTHTEDQTAGIGKGKLKSIKLDGYKNEGDKKKKKNSSA